MIKASIDTLMPEIEKLFNSIFNQGTMPQTWCGSLIIPIYKSGGRSDPANYRDICVSSFLGKLFCSILNQRLLEYRFFEYSPQISNWLFTEYPHSRPHLESPNLDR